MNRIDAFRRSLRFKILALTAGVVIGLMFIISVGILLQWRSLILKELNNKAQSITHAFSISVLDALIYGESQNLHVEDLLESYISDLKRSVPSIRYIVITDNNRRVVVHSEPTMYHKVLNDSLSRRLNAVQHLVSGIYFSQPYGWILETAMPLQIWGKRWGTLRIAYDAENARQEIKNVFLILLSVTLILTIAVLLVLFYFINRMFHSLHRLVRAMDAFELHEQTVPALPKRDDEIGHLIKHFEMLQQRLQQSHQKLLLAQKQVYHAEKLASIGRLASGVAHEINNPLNGIKNCLYAIRSNPNDQALQKKYLDLIDEGFTQIETIVQKLLSFSRTAVKNVSEVDVNQMIRQVVELLDYRLKQKRVELHLKLSERLPLIQADYGLLQEVIMNLLLNSYDAVQDGGWVQIETKLTPEQNLIITVCDNGQGIPQEHLEHIFEPFFTTKDPGQGTGLGLSVALEIVEAHGGTLSVQSVPGKETCFRIELPVERNQ